MTSSRRFLFLLLAAGSAAPARLYGQDSLTTAVTAAAEVFMREGRIPGLALGVIRGGRPVYARGFGVVRLGSDTVVTERTLFHMASVTKPFVATAIMQLVEQGRIDLDKTVVTYLPYFKMKDARAERITIRQVLNHTAGIPDVTDYAWDRPEYDAGALERYIRGLADSTLQSDPGAKWDYSNIGFELLADVIAKVSGEPFEDYIQRHILTPVGMKNSTLLMTDVDSSLLAWGHVHPEPTRVEPNSVYPYNRRHAASSTLHSNVVDMLRWALVNLHRGELNGNRILMESSYGKLWTPTRDMTAEIQERARGAGIELPYENYAIGLSWFVVRYHGKRLITHSGGDRGFRSDLYLAPDDSIAVVVMANDQTADVQKLARSVLDIAFRR
jgi:CubicO group peptidase (beta-lactamase class C family)